MGDNLSAKSAASKVGQTKKIYVALRSDGLGGSGTKLDPYDASTAAKLDNILRAISDGTTIHFGPGLFLSNGFQDGSSSLGFYVKPGCRYIGAGESQTTFRVMSTSTGNIHLGGAFCSWNPNDSIIADVSGASVEHMTIDINGAALVAGGAGGADLATLGVSLPGINNTIRHIHLIGMYGHEATGREAFGLGTVVSATNSTLTGNLIENCAVDNFASGNDYGQMICITGGIARNNWVIGQTTLTSAYQAYGANEILDNCNAINCKMFLYMDTGDAGPVWVKNCHAWGITGHFVGLSPSAGFSHHDVTVINNTAEIASGGTFLTAHPGGKGAKLYNISVLNNTTTKTSGLFTPLNLEQVRNFHSVGNRWLKTSAKKEKVGPITN